MNEDKLLRRHFEIFSHEGDVFSGDWLHDYFEKYADDLNIIYSGSTDSDNPACGDEGERIYEQRSNEETFYITANSSGGPYGPFVDEAETAKSLGYDPECFDIYTGPFDPSQELEEAECPFCGKKDSYLTCEHHLATIQLDEIFGSVDIVGGVLDEDEHGQFETLTNLVEEAFQLAQETETKPSGARDYSSLDALMRKSKSRSKKRPFKVDHGNFGPVLVDLLEGSDAQRGKRTVCNQPGETEVYIDFHAENPEATLERSKSILRQWLEIPQSPVE